MNSNRCFAPDLIVEATSVCDRQCPGCYAPNVVSRESPLKLLANRPDLFLAPERLEEALINLSPASSTWQTIGIRGGEPTRHPGLPDILRCLAKHSPATLYLETHGRWLLAGSESDNQQSLLEAMKDTRTVIKISFDQMHGLSPMALREITSALDQHDIAWCVAITEAREAAFMIARILCDWVSDDRIIFQEKVTTAQKLIRPHSAVIRTNGQLASEVSTRVEFQVSEMPTLPPLEASP